MQEAKNVTRTHIILNRGNYLYDTETKEKIRMYSSEFCKLRIDQKAVVLPYYPYMVTGIWATYQPECKEHKARVLLETVWIHTGIRATDRKWYSLYSYNTTPNISKPYMYIYGDGNVLCYYDVDDYGNTGDIQLEPHKAKSIPFNCTNPKNNICLNQFHPIDDRISPEVSEMFTKIGLKLVRRINSKGSMKPITGYTELFQSLKTSQRIVIANNNTLEMLNKMANVFVSEKKPVITYNNGMGIYIAQDTSHPQERDYYSLNPSITNHVYIDKKGKMIFYLANENTHKITTEIEQDSIRVGINRLPNYINHPTIQLTSDVIEGLKQHPKFKYCAEYIKQIWAVLNNIHHEHEILKRRRSQELFKSLLCLLHSVVRFRYFETLLKHGLVLQYITEYLKENNFGCLGVWGLTTLRDWICVGQPNDKAKTLYDMFNIPKPIWNTCIKESIPILTGFRYVRSYFNYRMFRRNDKRILERLKDLNREDFMNYMTLLEELADTSINSRCTGHVRRVLDWRIQELISEYNCDYGDVLKLIHKGFDLTTFRDYCSQKEHIQRRVSRLSKNMIEETIKNINESGSNNINVEEFMNILDMKNLPRIPSNPNMLLSLHNMLSRVEGQIQLVSQETEVRRQNELYKERHKMLKRFEYENDEYAIVVPTNVIELIYEGNSLHHCVGGYCNRVANGDSNIVFLRKKGNKNLPYCTIEILPKNRSDHKITKETVCMCNQIYTAHDQNCTDRDLVFLKEWARVKNIDVTSVRKMSLSYGDYN